MYLNALLKRLFTAATLLLPSVTSFSQDHYFQQEVNFKISVTLNDRLHELSAFETIGYTNHSPDTLRILYFHLWPNAYSDNNTPLARQLMSIQGKQKLFNKELSLGFIDSLDFRADEDKIRWEILSGHPDICILHLIKPVLPGKSVTITTPFKVKIPEGNFSRMGFSEGAYQVSQWYPKPAVYDNEGWHQMSYLDQGEFFSEFGSFDVSITIPENYTIAASGELQTRSEIERLDKLSAGIIPSGWNQPSDSIKVLDYHAENVHDFAWVAGKNFLVAIDTLASSSGKAVKVMVMYTPSQAFIWNDALNYMKSALFLFSGWIGEYPYNSFVAVQSALAAGSGMEYPGMAVIGDQADAYSLEEVIAHELCHSWFYGALGSNERRYPFIDEGLASAYEERYMELSHPGKKLWEVYLRNRRMAEFFHITDMPVGMMAEIQWLAQARNNLEQSANLSAEKYTDRNYSDIIYFKSAKGFNYLRNYLGDHRFDSIMHVFYASWSGSHPSPADLRSAFEKGSGKDLSWFFDDYLGTVKRADFSLSKLHGDSILVKNKGELNAPLMVYGLSKGKVNSVQWINGFQGKKWIHIDNHGFDELRINYAHLLPEVNYLNNNIRSNGLFRKKDPLRIKMVMSIEDPSERSVMFTPLVNWTRIDGFMAGAGFNNGLLLPKRTEVFAVPFYAFRNHGISGKARLAYNITPYNTIIRKAVISISGSRFGSPWAGHYYVLESGLDIHLKSNHPLSFIDQFVFGRFTLAKAMPVAGSLDASGDVWFQQLGYTFDKGSLLDPYRFTSILETNGSYQKISADFRYRFSYYKNRGLDIRLFAGAILREDKERSFYSLAPAGRSGRELYMYQGDFPDRFAVFPSTFWSRQMILNEGGIVSPVNETLSYSPWLFSVSLTSNLPGKAGIIPFKPFANFLWNGANQLSFLGEAGFKAGFWDVFEIYAPVIVTNNIKAIRSTVRERIRFTLNLETLFRLKLQ